MSFALKPDFYGILSETEQIINAHSRHFLALSLLFILPTTLSNALFPTLQKQHLFHESNTLTIGFIYLAFEQILSSCAVGTITYSVLRGFYGRPVDLLPAIRSLLNSFLPLLLTNIVSQAVSLVGFFLVGFVLSTLVFNGVVFLGSDFSYIPPYIFIGFSVVCFVFSMVWSVYVLVNWRLASVVVVEESSWGYEPLRWSANLVRGKRWVALSLLLCFQFLTAVLMNSRSVLAGWLGGDGSSGWRGWAFVVQIVVTAALGTWLMLHSIAANTVFYIYCKAMHGELALEIAHGEYISLPLDDEKPLHLASVIQTC